MSSSYITPRYALFIPAMLIIFCLATPSMAVELQLDSIKLPDGFKIAVYAADVKDARMLARGDKGTIFVSTRSRGNGSVYALVDADTDNVADKVHVIASGLNMPNGVAFRDGSLYVAAVNRILRFDDIESKLENPPEPVVVTDTYPTETTHGWKFIRFSPEGRLFVPVGSPCNNCIRDDDPRFATITSIKPDGSDLQIHARGIRNSLGFDWHPVTKELWFTENGADNLGKDLGINNDDVPADELNHLSETGQHFGFPFVHGTDIVDPTFGKDKDLSQYRVPAQDLAPHAAALGMRFYTGDLFPAEYKNQIFIAEHGSTNRSADAPPTGYCVSLVRLDGNKAASYETFAEGWINPPEKRWGRPVDLLVMPDGAMLVSDDFAGAVYRITYEK